MRYSSEPLFPYADGKYMLMPADLPDRFYPQDPAMRREVGNQVICFLEDVPEEMKDRLVKDYEKYLNGMMIKDL